MAGLWGQDTAHACCQGLWGLQLRWARAQRAAAQAPGPTRQGLAARAHPTPQPGTAEVEAPGQSMSLASHTSLGTGMGQAQAGTWAPGCAWLNGPRDQAGLWGARDWPCCGVAAAGNEVGSWAVGRVRGVPGGWAGTVWPTSTLRTQTVCSELTLDLYLDTSAKYRWRLVFCCFYLLLLFIYYVT